MCIAVGFACLVVLALVVLCVLSSIKAIGPTEVGLVTKRFGLVKLGEDNGLDLLRTLKSRGETACRRAPRRSRSS